MAYKYFPLSLRFIVLLFVNIKIVMCLSSGKCYNKIMINGPSPTFIVDDISVSLSRKSSDNLQQPTRRENIASIFGGIMAVSTSMAATPTKAKAVSPPPPRRNVDVGGGTDMFSVLPSTTRPLDVIYPPSMEGLWLVEKTVVSVEGDTFMAETIWKSLGGGGLNKNSKELFKTRYIKGSSPAAKPDDFVGVKLDRGYEMESRISQQQQSQQRPSTDIIQWDEQKPNILLRNREGNSNNIEIAVVQRSVEPPTDAGFGFNELYRITDGPFAQQRAARVQRRYRRSFDDDGNRVVEGLEIQKTYRVLDNIAGTEIPTSTTKSMIRMTRPK